MRRARGKRGRPPKFGRPRTVIALTLPDEVVRGRRRIDDEIAWAIVHLFEQEVPTAQACNSRATRC